jgi:hypothetical protein
MSDPARADKSDIPYAEWIADALRKSREHTTVPTRLTAHQIRTLHVILRAWNADRQDRGLPVLKGTDALDRILETIRKDVCP